MAPGRERHCPGVCSFQIDPPYPPWVLSTGSIHCSSVYSPIEVPLRHLPSSPPWVLLCHARLTKTSAYICYTSSIHSNTLWVLFTGRLKISVELTLPANTDFKLLSCSLFRQSTTYVDCDQTCPIRPLHNADKNRCGSNCDMKRKSDCCLYLWWNRCSFLSTQAVPNCLTV